MSDSSSPSIAPASDLSAYTAADWRGAAAPKPAPVRRAVSEKARWMIDAKRGTRAQESIRARAIMAEARTLVRDAYDKIAHGERVDLKLLDPVVDAIMASIERDPMAIPAIARLKMRHEYTFYHSLAVCGLMVGLGRALRLDDKALHDIGTAGLLHDVGKAKIPLALLDKPGALTDAEYEMLQKHTMRGHEVLASAGASDAALDVALNHHERLDGSGYPHGKTGAALSMHSRMSMICDVFDAMTSARSYKSAWSPGAALEWMRGERNGFDGTMLKTFAMTLGPYPPGSLVRLKDERLAVVLDPGLDDPLDPPLVIVADAGTRRRLPLVRKDHASSQIVAVEYAERLAIPDWPTIRDEAMKLAAA